MATMHIPNGYSGYTEDCVVGDKRRMGNQMHMIAATYALSLNVGEPCELPPWAFAQYFPNFNSCITTTNNPSIEFIYNEPPLCKLKLTPETFQYIPKVKKLKICGGFESAKFFEGREKEIKHLFWMPTQEHNACGIHVRRNDYLQHDFIIKLTMDYYTDAINRIGASKYIVCSDDVEWCKQNFVGPQFEFPNGTQMEDFATLMGCEHLINANSTFSWWAALLMKHEKGTVIAPRHSYLGFTGTNDWYKTINTNWTLINTI